MPPRNCDSKNIDDAQQALDLLFEQPFFHLILENSRVRAKLAARLQEAHGETALATPDQTPSPASSATGAVHSLDYEDDSGLDQPAGQYTFIIETPTSMASSLAAGCESTDLDQGSREDEGCFIPSARVKAAVRPSPDKAFKNTWTICYHLRYPAAPQQQAILPNYSRQKQLLLLIGNSEEEEKHASGTGLVKLLTTRHRLLELYKIYQEKKAEAKRLRKPDRVRQEFIKDRFPEGTACHLTRRQKENNIGYVIKAGRVLFEMEECFGWGSLVEPGLRLTASMLHQLNACDVKPFIEYIQRVRRALKEELAEVTTILRPAISRGNMPPQWLAVETIPEGMLYMIQDYTLRDWMQFVSDEEPELQDPLENPIVVPTIDDQSDMHSDNRTTLTLPFGTSYKWSAETTALYGASTFGDTSTESLLIDDVPTSGDPSVEGFFSNTRERRPSSSFSNITTVG